MYFIQQTYLIQITDWVYVHIVIVNNSNKEIIIGVVQYLIIFLATLSHELRSGGPAEVFHQLMPIQDTRTKREARQKSWHVSFDVWFKKMKKHNIPIFRMGNNKQHNNHRSSQKKHNIPTFRQEQHKQSSLISHSDIPTGTTHQQSSLISLFSTQLREVPSNRLLLLLLLLLMY